ncbi:tetratricopeptide repeat protein 32-like [Artemia franciscana]
MGLKINHFLNNLKRVPEELKISSKRQSRIMLSNCNAYDFECQEKQITEEIKSMERLLSESDETSLKLAQLYNNRGWTRYMQVDFYKAIEDYNLALKYQPKLSEALYNRGTINYRMGWFDLAVKDLELATTINPNNPEFKEGLANALEQLKNQELSKENCT